MNGGYLRVSSSAQGRDDRVSIGEQKADCEALAAKFGETIDVWYVDKEQYVSGETGRRVQPSGSRVDRPAFVQMLADMASGKLICIYGWAQDRLARGSRATSVFVEAVEKYKVAVRLVNGEFDIRTAEIMGAVSGYEIRVFKERSMMGREGQAGRGLHMGQAPFGYRPLRSETGKRIGYEFIDSEHDQLKRMARYLLEGLSFYDIALRLGTSVRTGKPWLPSSVHYTLANPFYRGLVAYGRHRKSNVIRSRGKQSPAWDAETLARVEAEMALRHERLQRGPRRSSHPHLFRGIVHCGICGRPMAATVQAYGKNKVHIGYRCNTRRQFKFLPGLPDHEPNHISERKILDSLIEILDGEVDLSLFAAPAIDDPARTAAELAELQGRGAELRTALEAVKGIPSAAAAIRSELERVTRLINELQAIESRPRPTVKPGEVEAKLAMLRAGLGGKVFPVELRSLVREAIGALYAVGGKLVRPQVRASDES